MSLTEREQRAESLAEPRLQRVELRADELLSDELRTNTLSSQSRSSEVLSGSSLPLVGRHLILDLYEVPAEKMLQADEATDRLRDDLIACGFHVLSDCRHAFPGGGATGLVLLSESHASFHTYPERNYVAFDVFGCGSADVDRLIERVIAVWQPGKVVRHELRRGSET